MNIKNLIAFFTTDKKNYFILRGEKIDDKQLRSLFSDFDWRTDLPPVGKKVLVFNLRDSEYAFLDEVKTGYWSGYGWYNFRSYHGYVDKIEVTHWMPLPEKPQK